MEMESRKDFSLGTSPKIILRSHRRFSEVENRSPKAKPSLRSHLLRLDEEFRGNSLSSSCSSCKSISSKCLGVEGDEVLKRASIYQSSKMKESGAAEDRRKIEVSCSNDYISSGIIDSLCSSDDESASLKHKRSSVRSRKSCPKKFSDFSFHPPTSRGKDPASSVSSDGLFEIVLNLDNRDSAEALDRDSTENLKFRSHQVAGPLNNGNELLERDSVVALHKSSSAKVRIPYSPSQSESDCSRDSPRNQFHPIRKVLDPFMKPMSRRSSLGSKVVADELTPFHRPGGRRKKTSQKSLLRDFANLSWDMESNSPRVKTDYHSVVPCSPVHLQGCLKLENRQGVPFFEFSLKCPEDVLVAKTWKTENAFNLVYTFHSIRGRKKNNVGGWGLRDSSRESSMVGQMQVSCSLCSEIKDDGALDNSLVTEFVLYDIAHARKSVAAKETSNCFADTGATHSAGSKEGSDRGIMELDNLSDLPKLKGQDNLASDHGDISSSTSCPWAPVDLHPYFEVAAVVIQVPFEKGENMKNERGDKISDKVHPSMLDLPFVEPRKKQLPNSRNPAKVFVVTSAGNHGLPSTESQGPSPVLDRWRSGGGCDCGGWDMACPLTVFGDSSVANCPLMENQQPLQLFVQGAKESIPALTIKLIEEGQYAVDFHARLSTLQAFSICVAILHGAEASIAVGQERNRQLQSNSLKMLIEEEVKFLIEAVAEEKMRKVSKIKQKIPQSFMVDPPFSPIARV
ncbi:uncharacterized protein LOC131164829 [Malania oleifera]|uniref:uncharacterized protein LOC131164829 n=1 Tax=Malania oleifera TaxID=397392 RepID=UPI0025AE98BA|nr:uncharacterized protein LOC131164829 [Malania oleifera]XP_057978307.1 uncharacterized protein LOC131164829 [Malania oleifera]XP_057978308.1 uncharacterized protein LOC131164829 [Malania oleifera]